MPVAVRSSSSQASWKETAEDAKAKASRAAARFNEFRKSAPGTVMTYGTGAAVASGILAKKMPTIGGIPSDLVAAAACAYYATQEESLEAAGAFVGFVAARAAGWGVSIADKLPNIGGK